MTDTCQGPVGYWIWDLPDDVDDVDQDCDRGAVTEPKQDAPTKPTREEALRP